jgi:hypothetical protein
VAKHIDRKKSEDAIDELIKNENEVIKKDKEDRKRRKEEGLPYDHLDKKIEQEEAKIAGKKEVKRLAHFFDTSAPAEDEIASEENTLETEKKILKKLRDAEPKDRAAIDKQDKKVDLLGKMIDGKKEALGKLVSD